MTVTKDRDRLDNKFESYNHPAKNSTRFYIRAYIKQWWKGEDCSQKKALILEGEEALTIKNILLPLGFRRENIYVAEMNKKRAKRMQSNPDFGGVKIIPADLKDFIIHFPFDYVHFDFKSEIHDKVLDITRRFLIKGTKPKTIFYLNVQAKREKAYIGIKFQKTLERVLRKLEALIKDNENALEVCEHPPDAEGLFQDEVGLHMASVMTNKRNASPKNVEKAFRKRFRKVDYEQLEWENDFFCLKEWKNLDGDKERFEEMIAMIEKEKKKDLIRRLFISRFIVESLDLVVSRFHLHKKGISKKKFIENYETAELPYSEEELLSIHDTLEMDYHALVECLRLITNSLVVRDYTDFRYISENHSPFLSTLVFLDDTDSVTKYPELLMNATDDPNYIETIFWAMMQLMYYKQIPFSRLTKELENFLTTHHMQVETPRGKQAVMTHIISETLRRAKYIYDTLLEHNILDINWNKMTIDSYSYNYEPYSKSKDFFIKESDVRNHFVDFSAITQRFYELLLVTIKNLNGQDRFTEICETPPLEVEWKLEGEEMIAFVDFVEAEAKNMGFYLPKLTEEEWRIWETLSEKERTFLSKLWNKNFYVYVYEDLSDEQKAILDALSPEEIKQRKDTIVDELGKITPADLEFDVEEKMPLGKGKYALSKQATIFLNEKLGWEVPVYEYEVRGHKGMLSKLENALKRSVRVEVSAEELETYREGSKRISTVTTVERNPNVRKKALEIHGCSCKVCGYEATTFYSGADADVGLEVHHLVPLSKSGEVSIHIETDVTVLCSRCHTFLHKYSPDDALMTVEEAKKRVLHQKNTL